MLQHEQIHLQMTGKIISKINHGSSYDQYYDKNESSVYHKLYEDKIIAFDRYLVERQTDSIAERNVMLGKGSVTILDYGCGDGRFFNLYKTLSAEIYQNYGLGLKVIGLDPSVQGLRYFAGRMATHKSLFIKNETFHDLSEQVGGNLGYVAGKYKYDNLEVTLIHSHVDDSLDHIESLIGEVDFTILMFSVLAHVIGEHNRVELLKMLDKVSYEIFYSVPGPAIFPKYQYYFDVIRKPDDYSEEIIANVTKSLAELKINPENFQVANEEGDIIYSRVEEGNAKVQNYMHIYRNSEEIKKELETANITDYMLGTNKIFHETLLIRHPAKSFVDAAISRQINCLEPSSLDKVMQKMKEINDALGYHLFGSYYAVLAIDNCTAGEDCYNGFI
jgi:SAM-dependent methyltransferase